MENMEIGLNKKRIAANCVCCNSDNILKSPAILMPFLSDRIFDWKPVCITDEWGLSTIENGMAYCICNSLQCQNCGHLFLDIRFDDNEMNALYSKYRESEYVKLREKYEPGYTQRNKNLDMVISYLEKVESFLLNYVTLPISVLDWGGDTGINTPFKKDINKFHIYDISNKEVIKEAKKVDIGEALGTTYDLIVCSNVIEHIPYPTEIMLDIRSVMSDKSILYVEVPYELIIQKNDSKKDLYKNKKHWHEHINFYTKNSLKILAANCGFEVIAIKEMKVSSDKEGSPYILQLACRVK